VLIGGTACSIALEDVGLGFRATKDLDIVICVEALDSEYVQAFWNFVQQGSYKHQQKSTGTKLFYRFTEPIDETFPYMLELFSRVPEALSISENSHLTPIPVDDEVSSLSAILLNNDYYDFIYEGKEEVDGLPIVMPVYLIPLKAKAWLDLTERREAGNAVDDKDIRKRRNDVFRLYQAITLDISVKTPDSIKDDMVRFFRRLQDDTSLNLPALGIRNTSLNIIVDNLKSVYGLDG
jgi:hypothetical protein